MTIAFVVLGVSMLLIAITYALIMLGLDTFGEKLIPLLYLLVPTAVVSGVVFFVLFTASLFAST